MEVLVILIGFWTAFLLALISPGPNFAVLLGTAIESGRGRSLRVAGGMVLGEAIWGLAAVLGVAVLVDRHPGLQLILQFGGGAFLLWLAFRSLAAVWRPQGAIGLRAGAAGVSGGIGRGLLLMLLNPKAGIFWISLAGIFIGPNAPLPLALTAVAGAVVISTCWHGLLAIAFTASKVLLVYARLRRGLDAILGAVLAALGLRLMSGG